MMQGYPAEKGYYEDPIKNAWEMLSTIISSFHHHRCFTFLNVLAAKRQRVASAGGGVSHFLNPPTHLQLACHCPLSQPPNHTMLAM